MLLVVFYSHFDTFVSCVLIGGYIFVDFPLSTGSLDAPNAGPVMPGNGILIM